LIVSYVASNRLPRYGSLSVCLAVPRFPSFDKKLTLEDSKRMEYGHK